MLGPGGEPQYPHRATCQGGAGLSAARPRHPGEGQASSCHPHHPYRPGGRLKWNLISAPRAESGHHTTLSPFPSPTLPLLPPTSGPHPTWDTYDPREGSPLHHVHELDGDLLPAAALGLLGAGAQVGAADDVLMVHQGAVPRRLLPRERQGSWHEGRHLRRVLRQCGHWTHA